MTKSNLTARGYRAWQNVAVLLVLAAGIRLAQGAAHFTVLKWFPAPGDRPGNVLDGRDGTLYGTTAAAEAGDLGTVFKSTCCAALKRSEVISSREPTGGFTARPRAAAWVGAVFLGSTMMVAIIRSCTTFWDRIAPMGLMAPGQKPR
jgi:hypothetical protein